VIHRDPVALLHEFIARDLGGEFLEANSWFEQAVSCPAREPGVDQFYVVRGYQLRLDTLSPDTLLADIQYEYVGAVAGAVVFLPDVPRTNRTLPIARGPFGWRIVSPALNQHVLLDVVRAFRWLPDSVRQKLEVAARHH
jgi:hypothetical protein